jgi:hypothetical protein
LRELWEEALKRGDIPGAYWAVLSHPAATEAIMRKAFGDVHMLSHMVGAANPADIRRLCQLEEQNAALAAKMEAQQLQLRDGFTERDNKIRMLNEALSRALALEIEIAGVARRQLFQKVRATTPVLPGRRWPISIVA